MSQKSARAKGLAAAHVWIMLNSTHSETWRDPGFDQLRWQWGGSREYAYCIDRLPVTAPRLPIAHSFVSGNPEMLLPYLRILVMPSRNFDQRSSLKVIQYIYGHGRFFFFTITSYERELQRCGLSHCAQLFSSSTYKHTDFLRSQPDLKVTWLQVKLW